jgi:hypothetical protein
MARKPFFGSSGAPAIAKMDMRAATEPGRAFGNMFSQLGEIAGVALRKHAENKEKKQNQELLEDYLKRNGYDEEDAKVISKIPEANRFVMDLKKFESDMETAETNREYLTSQTSINEANLENTQEKFDSEMETANSNRDYLESQTAIMDANLENAREEKEEQEAMNRFLLTSTERMPTKAEGRHSVLENLRAGKGVTPPVRMIKEDSVAVSQLPDPYKKFGRKIEKAVQDKQISPDVGAGLIREKQAQALSLMGEGLQLTEGEIERDKAFARDFVDFNEPDIAKGLTQLSEAVKELETKENLTGPLVSLMPDMIESRVNPDATAVREAVEEVVQRNLRLVLGAQFTAEEGKRLIERAFNRKLSQEENAKRVKRLITSIQTALKQKKLQQQYFATYGTLKGYNYQPYSYKEAEADMLKEVNLNEPASEASIQRLQELKKLAEQRGMR